MLMLHSLNNNNKGTNWFRLGKICNYAGRWAAWHRKNAEMLIANDNVAFDYAVAA